MMRSEARSDKVAAESVTEVTIDGPNTGYYFVLHFASVEATEGQPLFILRIGSKLIDYTPRGWQDTSELRGDVFVNAGEDITGTWLDCAIGAGHTLYLQYETREIDNV